jgi:DNA-binding MarR family transcriptional regulator
LSEFRDEQSCAERLLVGLSRIGTVLRSQAWQGASPRGIHPTQAQVLVFLARTRPRGLRLSELADRLAVTRPTASESVSALERKGLLVRRRDPVDGRAIQIHLSPEGELAAEEVAEWPDLLIEVVDGLDPEEKGALLRTLMKLIFGLQARGRIATHRMCVTCRYFQPDAHPDPERPHHCGFVDAPFGDHQLRIDCREYEEVDDAKALPIREAFAKRTIPKERRKG